MKIHISKTVGAIAGSMVVSALMAGCGGGPAGSADEVSLRFADGLPESHYLSKEFVQVFISEAEDIAAQGGHDLTIEHFPDSQLGDTADQVDNMGSGVFDGGLVASAYNTDQMPASDAFNLPTMSDDASVLTTAYDNVLADPDSEIVRRDFAENGTVAIAGAVAPIYELALSSGIDALSSIKGKKVRVSGGVQTDMVDALGGAPVSMSTAEQYESLERGVIDGGVFNTVSMVDNRTAEVLDAFTTNADLGAFSSALSMSSARWDGLPEWAQDALIEAGQVASEHFASVVTGLDKDSIETLQADFDMTAVELSDDDLASIQQTLGSLPEKWAAAASGFDGEAALDEARTAIEGAR